MTTTLLHVFPSFAIGGAQARFIELANNFGPDFRHLIVAMDGDVSCGARLSDELSVSYPPIALSKGDTVGNLRAIREALRQWRPDVLVTSNWGSIEWAMANFLRLTAHIHMEDGFGPEERQRQLPRRVWIRRAFLRRSLIMLPSRTLERVARTQWRLPGRTLRYIPNGIDLRRFQPLGRQRPAATPVVIGTVAALRAEKNVGRLIHAFAKLRDVGSARLLIVGDGPERAKLETLVDSLGVAGNVSFLGYIANPAPVYEQFDIFALSSDTEQMPISVLEAMACGLPIVSTAVGDVALMLGVENGASITGLHDADLTAQIEPLIASTDLRRRFGSANRGRVERDYTLEGMVRAHANLIEEARSRGPKAFARN